MRDIRIHIVLDSLRIVYGVSESTHIGSLIVNELHTERTLLLALTV